MQRPAVSTNAVTAPPRITGRLGQRYLAGVEAFGPRIVAWWRAFLRGPVLVVAVQAFALAFVAWPWIRPDLQWNDVADAPNHLVRLFAVSQAFARGEVYPRWLSDLYLGYG